MPWRTIDPQLLIRFLRETAAVTFVVRGDGYVLDEPEWMALTGQTEAEAEGDGWMNAVHPEDVDRVRSAWQTAVAHSTHYNTDYRLRCADGAYRWFNARGTPVLDTSGETLSWVGVILAVPGMSRISRGNAHVTVTSTDRFDDITPGALRSARALLNLPAEKLAEEAGVSRSTYRRLEEDAPSASPRRSSISKVIQVLGAHKLKCIGRGRLIVGVLDDSDSQSATNQEQPTSTNAQNARTLQ